MGTQTALFGEDTPYIPRRHADRPAPPQPTHTQLALLAAGPTNAGRHAPAQTAALDLLGALPGDTR